MAAWKVLVIGVLAVALLALVCGTGLALMSGGADRWAWFGGLLAATLAEGGALVAFLRYADRSFDAGARRR